MSDAIVELVKILPENDWLKAFTLISMVMLVVLREKLFTGMLEVCRFSLRWVKCQILRKHTRIMRSGTFDEGSMLVGTFRYTCLICGDTVTNRGML